MWRIRKFEEEGTRLFKAGHILGAYHASIGEEAAIVGACLALRDDDSMTGTHRSHGHPIGKGADLKALMAELMGKQTGICKGRGGSMHLADNSVGIIGESAIVGGGIPLATGCGLSAKVRGTDQVSLCFFGDGAVNQGTFHESLNMASLWKLPVIYLCENNGYAITTSLARSHGQPNIAKRAGGYGMPGVSVDGQDVGAVFEATSGAVARARRGEGPSLIDAKTYRFDEHNVGLIVPGEPYRTSEEIEHHITIEIRWYCTGGFWQSTELPMRNWTRSEMRSPQRSMKRSDSARKVRFRAPTLYDYLYCNPAANVARPIAH